MPRISNEDKYNNLLNDMTLEERTEFFKTIRRNAVHLSKQYPGRHDTLKKLQSKACTRQDGKHIAAYHDYVAQMKRQLKARNQELDDPHNI